MASESGTPRPGLLTLEQLRVAIGEGEINTVVLAFTDMQGRLAGKRLSGEFFLDEVAEHYSEGCNYLLAVDVDMNTVDGYAMSSWERGYGNFVLVPDMSTLRQVPWQEATAMVIADLTWLDGTPVAASPRQILQAQTARLAERGLVALAGTELEFIVYRDTYEEAAAKEYRDLVPANTYNVDYSILGTARIEPLLRRIRNGMTGAGLYVESAKGECNLGQHEIAFRYAEAVTTCDNHSIYKNRVQGDRRPGRHEPYVHGQAERPRGQLLPHPPVGAFGGGRFPGDGFRFRGVRHVPVGRALPGRAAGRDARADPGLRAEHQLLQALRAGQLRADLGALGP